MEHMQLQFVVFHSVVVLAGLLLSGLLALGQEEKALTAVNVHPRPITTDNSVKYDYDIVYVRAPRYGDDKRAQWADFSDPLRMEPGADLMLLHPNGAEEMLVSGQDGSVMDPFVSFNGQWVYYVKFTDAQHNGADIYKIHVASKKIIRLTDQIFTPNTGAANWSNYRRPQDVKTALGRGVYNIGPTPAPDGKIIFTSDRNAYVPPRGYPRTTQQLFSMDEDGANVEQIGYLNIASALHPVILKDGRIIYSTLESHAQHNAILWGIWSIHPDGTNWAPVVSAFATHGAPSGFHCQTQLSDESLVVERYYNQNNSGFGTYFKLPPRVPAGLSAFGPGSLDDPRNKRMGGGRSGYAFQMPFTPYGMELLTPFAHGDDGPASSSMPGEAVRPRKESGQSYPQALGKVTHPSGAPDNHLLTVWTPGPANHQYGYYPFIDGGIYLIKDAQPIDEPGKMLLIKNDPRYNEQ